MRAEICAMCKVKTSKVGILCPSENEPTCHASPTLEKYWEKEWSGFEPQWRAIVLLAGVKANETDKILTAISYFDTPEDAINYANEEIARYTTSNFSAAWFYEEVKRLAKACAECEMFSGKYNNCDHIHGKRCELKPEKAFYNQKTVAQQVAEDLGIAYLGV